EIEAILTERPRLGELADDVEVLVAGDEPAVEHRADLERGAVAQHVRDQARDVPRQRLDEGVTVGGLLAGAGAPLLDRAVGLTAARRESEGGRGRQRDDGERQLHAQRVWPGGAGATGAGAGAAGAGPPGVGTAGAGALGAGGASRTTEPLRSPPMRARLNDVSVKMIAIAVVIFPRTVGVPIEPKTAWVPAPPNAEPMSAPLPACSSTMPMIAKDARMWTTINAVNIPSLLRRRAAARRLLDDRDKPRRVQAGATDERAIDFGLGDEALHVLGLDAAAVEDPDGLRDVLRGELGNQPAEVAVHLGRLTGRRVHAGADRPDGLVGEHRLDGLVRRQAGEASAQLALDRRERQPLAALVGGLADAEHGRETVRERGADLLVDQLVGLADLLAALGVAEQHVPAAELDEHRGCDLARVGARRLVVAGLRAQEDRAPARSSPTAASAVNGGQRTTWTPRGRRSPSRIAPASTFASATVPCIFQLPMTSGVLMPPPRGPRRPGACAPPGTRGTRRPLSRCSRSGPSRPPAPPRRSCRRRR